MLSWPPNDTLESESSQHELLELGPTRRDSADTDHPVGTPTMDVPIRNHEHTDNIAPEAHEESSNLLSRDNEVQGHRSRIRTLLLKLRTSFFLFGLVNNVLYVIILSAALDLVPPSTPKGIIAFCNILPALVAKLGWPYLLKGRIRYAKRLIGCTIISISGMLVVALFDSLFMRLLGISLASFSSGLGELTFLQLSTTYHPPSVAGHSVGYFASGTGAAGLVGAFLWWEVRSLGVRVGVGLSSALPLAIPLAYYYLLPSSDDFSAVDVSSYEDEVTSTSVATPYTPLPTSQDDEPSYAFRSTTIEEGPKHTVTLSVADKWKLAKPLIAKYMLPLFSVYLFEYTINQGIAPTLVFPVPDRYWPINKIIRSIRDYYPLWQLVYQTTVFLSRSAISLGFPPLPERLISLPAIIQGFILVTLAFESAVGIFSDSHEIANIFLVFVLISIEGICGGLAYVNVFYRINQEKSDPSDIVDPERERQEREFKIGSIGLADSTGILLASMVAVPTEVGLCKIQIARGKDFCKSL